MFYLINIILIGCLLLPMTAAADHPGASFETGAAGPVLTTPGVTLERGKSVLGFRSQYINFNEISDARLQALGLAGEHVHSTGSLLNLSVNLARGLTDDLTLGFSAPYVDRGGLREVEHHHGTGEIIPVGDASGFGDISLFGQYRFHRGYRGNTALIAGLKAPTGETDVTKPDGDRFETKHQPGSGSWDPFIGLDMEHGQRRDRVISQSAVYLHYGRFAQYRSRQHTELQPGVDLSCIQSG